ASIWIGCPASPAAAGAGCGGRAAGRYPLVGRRIPHLLGAVGPAVTCRTHLPNPGVPMSYRCEVCGKEPSYGKNVTISHKRNNRRWLPNSQRGREKHGSNTRRTRVCTSCIRAGKVEKA